MSESSQGQLQNFTIDQFAGSAALIIGSIGALLTIIWQSRCLCRCRIGCSDQCYIFDCSREPPPIVTDEEAGDIIKKEDEILKKEDEIFKKHLIIRGCQERWNPNQKLNYKKIILNSFPQTLQ